MAAGRGVAGEAEAGGGACFCLAPLASRSRSLPMPTLFSFPHEGVERVGRRDAWPPAMATATNLIRLVQLVVCIGCRLRLHGRSPIRSYPLLQMVSFSLFRGKHRLCLAVLDECTSHGIGKGKTKLVDTSITRSPYTTKI
eukprot:scaffold7034_cov31-Tisochrysis_lutea.AAC.5